MQSTGQTSTHAVSLVPTHGSQMIYAIATITIIVHTPPQRTLRTRRKLDFSASSAVLSGGEFDEAPVHRGDFRGVLRSCLGAGTAIRAGGPGRRTRHGQRRRLGVDRA